MSTRYSPELVERMQRSNCYNCGQRGHWACDCPSSKKNPSRSFNHDYPINQQRIFCHCGYGLCVVKKSKYGREYYACPIKRGKPCSEFVQWCDVPIDRSYMQPPPYKYPECECKTGVCRKVKDPDADKYYFACPIQNGHGSCGYKVWEDELLDNKSIVPIQQSSDQKHYDLGEGGDLLAEHSNRMIMMDNSETPLLVAVSDDPERDTAAPKAASSNFPEFEVADDLQEVVNSVPWDAVEKEALLLSRWSTPSKISCQQNLFGNSSFASAVANASIGISPSFDEIVVAKQANIGDDPCERNELAISNLNEHAQLSSSDCHNEVSRDIVRDSPIIDAAAVGHPFDLPDQFDRDFDIDLKNGLFKDSLNTNLPAGLVDDDLFAELDRVLAREDPILARSKTEAESVPSIQLLLSCFELLEEKDLESLAGDKQLMEELMNKLTQLGSVMSQLPPNFKTVALNLQRFYKDMSEQVPPAQLSLQRCFKLSESKSNNLKDLKNIKHQHDNLIKTSATINSNLDEVGLQRVNLVKQLKELAARESKLLEYKKKGSAALDTLKIELSTKLNEGKMISGELVEAEVEAKKAEEVIEGLSERLKKVQQSLMALKP